MSEPTTLTREQAIALIEQCGGDPVLLRAIAAHWDIAGHWNQLVPSEQWIEVLNEHIDCVASGDDQRSNGPKDSDDTGLTIPPGLGAAE